MSDEQAFSMEDFSDLIDDQMDSYNQGFNPGETIDGIITVLGKEFIIIDLNAKREGIIEREELVDDNGELTVKVGDEISAYFVAMSDGAFLLSNNLAGAAAQQEINAAIKNDMPVEGTVKKEINGGYEINVGGDRAFCPYSQMDLYRKEASEFLEKKLQFMVTEYDAQDHNIVLSRRELLERERQVELEELKKSLEEGQVRDGVVTRIADFGAFVDLGGIDGLIPLHELTWDRKAKVEDIVQEGEKVKVVVLKIDWEENRISLSLRYAEGNPWDAVSIKYPVGSEVHVTITRLANYGAFAELEPGVEGLIHISKLGNGRRIAHAKEAVEVDQELDVIIESIDIDAQRIGLKVVDERMDALSAGNKIEEGSIITGIVEGHRDFGVFIKINEAQTGLLHISETKLPRGGSPLLKLEQEYPAGSEIELIVKALDGTRISLTLPEVWQEKKDEAEALGSSYIKKTASTGFGSMGDAFAGLNLK